MKHGRRTNGERLKRLAAVGRVSGVRGARRPDTLWRVEVIGKAFTDAQRLFLRVPAGPDAHAVTIDGLGLLALFPDKRPSIAGELFDLAYERVAGEAFYRLRIDDPCFAGRTLWAFFYPAANIVRSAEGPGTIHVVGFAWEPQAVVEHVVARIRDRVEAVLRREGR